MTQLTVPFPDCETRRAAGGCETCEARPFSVCAAVSDADLSRLERLSEHVVLAAGQALVREGDPVTHVFNVTSGLVRASRLLEDGRRQVTGFLFPGDFLGLTGTETWADTIEAVEPATVCRFRRADYRGLMADHRELEQALLARTGRELAAAHHHALLLGRKNALERVASFLLRLPVANPLSVAPPGHVRLPMTRGEIADHLGLTLETVSRTFSRLKKMGLIRQVSLTEIVVARPERLVEIAEGRSRR